MKPHMYLLNKYWEPTIVYLDEMKEGREKDYKTLSGWSLTGEEPKEEAKAEVIIDWAEVVTEYNPELEEALNKELEDLKEEYKVVYGKEVPVNKKNDRERIHTKIMDITNPETLTPVE